jgi:hypothetical protein
MSGQQICHDITQSECAQKGGVFYEGSFCPASAAMAKAPIKPDAVASKKPRKSVPAQKKKKKLK